MPDDPLDQLYAASLEDFVTTRNRIAAELRRADRREEADEVKALRKPSVVVWALNRLARTDARNVGALIDAAEQLRAVQSGRSDASFAAAQTAFSDAAWGLARAAAGELADAGRKPSDAVVQRLGRALTAAAASPETSELLRAGRLTNEPETVGFAGIGPVAARKADRAKGDRRGERERRAAERAAEQERARRDALAEVQRELRDAKAEAARLGREAERAQDRVVRLERKAAALRDS